MRSLESVHFNGFDDKLPWSSIFKRSLIEFEYGDKITYVQFLKMVTKILLFSFISRDYFIFENENSRIIFFLSYFQRRNVNEGVDNVRGLVKSDFLGMNHKYIMQPFQTGLRLFFCKVPRWFREMKELDFSLYERFRIVENLLTMFRMQEFLSTLNCRSYNLLVTYYDSLEYESFMVEYFRNLGVKTASLQHGQFVGWRENSFINCGIELKTFKSDYLLCWNKFTVDEAVKMGIPKEKLVLTGMWTYLNKKREFCDNKTKGVFGVVISHPSWDRENKDMVKAANVLSEKFGLKYFLKLHPFYRIDAFDSFVNKNCQGLINRELSVFEYSNEMDFSIVGSSTLFAELAFVGHDVYHYSSGRADDKYKSVTIAKIFKDEKELLGLYRDKKNENYSEQLFDYLCSVENPANEYRKFFSQFL